MHSDSADCDNDNTVATDSITPTIFYRKHKNSATLKLQIYSILWAFALVAEMKMCLKNIQLRKSEDA